MLRIAIALVVLCGIARADSTFAIDLRSKDALADKITSALEDALRARGSLEGAEYRAKGTRKDRVAASTDDCPSALTARCAKAIGARLGVDYMFAGTVETRGKRFVLSLDVIHVKTGHRMRSLRDLAATTIDAKKWAKLVYGRIVESASGSLVITCNAGRAAVFVDGQQATELFQGRGTVTSLAPGTHAIEIRAAGFKSYVDEVSIEGETPLNVLLERAE